MRRPAHDAHGDHLVQRRHDAACGLSSAAGRRMVGRRLPHPDAERRLFEWVQRRLTGSGYFSDEVQVMLLNAVKQGGLEVTLSPGRAGCGGFQAGSAYDNPTARTSG